MDGWGRRDRVSSQALTAQFEYWPYGELATEIEAGVGPFLWVGSLGYFRDGDLTTYVRARTYRQDLGSWTQLDPLWPSEPTTLYAGLNPTSLADKTGYQVSKNRLKKRRKRKTRFGPRPIRPKPIPALVVELIGWGLVFGSYDDIQSLIDSLSACALGADGWTNDECRDCCAEIAALIGGAAAGGVAAVPGVVTGPLAPLIVVGIGWIGGEAAGWISRDTLCSQICNDSPGRSCRPVRGPLPVTSGTHFNRGAGGAIIDD